jgi:hypothetical protein
MHQQLHVDTAGLQAMGARWGVSAVQLSETVAPTALGPSCQASAVAVDIAHADITAFAAALATTVGTRATRVTEAESRYNANEADAANELSAVTHPTISA